MYVPALGIVVASGAVSEDGSGVSATRCPGLPQLPVVANAILVVGDGVAPVNVIAGCVPAPIVDGLIDEIELDEIAMSPQSKPV